MDYGFLGGSNGPSRSSSRQSMTGTPTPKPPALKIYISFSNSSKRTRDVFTLADLLNYDYDVFIDRNNSAESLSMAAAQAIVDADVVLAFYDRTYAQSRLAMQEFFQADVVGKFVIPVKLEEILKTPGESWLRAKLRDRFYVDYDDSSSPTDAIIDKIISRIDILMGRPERPKQSKGKQETVSRDEFDALTALVARQQRLINEMALQISDLQRQISIRPSNSARPMTSSRRGQRGTVGVEASGGRATPTVIEHQNDEQIVIFDEELDLSIDVPLSESIVVTNGDQ